MLRVGRSSRSAAWGESAYVADAEESELRALWNVIKHAQYRNPKEFDLPKDLIPGVKLPGEWTLDAIWFVAMRFGLRMTACVITPESIPSVIHTYFFFQVRTRLLQSEKAKV